MNFNLIYFIVAIASFVSKKELQPNGYFYKEQNKHFKIKSHLIRVELSVPFLTFPQMHQTNLAMTFLLIAQSTSRILQRKRKAVV